MKCGTDIQARWRNTMKPISRREFLLSSSGFVVGASVAFVGSRYWLLNYTEPGKEYVLRQKQGRLRRALVSKEGKTIPVSFQSSVTKLTQEGVIDLKKWNTLYSTRSQKVPDQIKKALSSYSQDPIRFNTVSAPFLLNILWALGISNQTKFNDRSPLQGKSLPRYASTGGWVLGNNKDGATYFNQVANVPLNAKQERLVLEVAKNIYRPCCNNSTFFQDCNHGSAMLGLLELGASQGQEEEDLYAIALTANTYWFPETYLQMALYFEEIEGKSHNALPSRKLLSRELSSASGFKSNILRKLAQRNLLPGAKGGVSKGCSV
jgi:hypothetical protein